MCVYAQYLRELTTCTAKCLFLHSLQLIRHEVEMNVVHAVSVREESRRAVRLLLGSAI